MFSIPEFTAPALPGARLLFSVGAIDQRINGISIASQTHYGNKSRLFDRRFFMSERTCKNVWRTSITDAAGQVTVFVPSIDSLSLT